MASAGHGEQAMIPFFPLDFLHCCVFGLVHLKEGGRKLLKAIPYQISVGLHLDWVGDHDGLIDDDLDVYDFMNGKYS
jgi:hypothetical protein